MNTTAVLADPRLGAPGECRAFEVVATVPRSDGGEPLVPRDLPPEVLGCWSADQLTVSATVISAQPSGAVAAVEELMPELARGVVTVRPVSPAAGIL